VHVGGSHTRLFGVLYVTYGDFQTVDQTMEQRACIKADANLGKSGTESLTMIQQAFGNQILRRK
jgi:hypothetical protein